MTWLIHSIELPTHTDLRLSCEATPSKTLVGGEDTLTAARASSLVEVNSDEDRTSSSPGASSVGGKKMMERTESLVSDVLSFYSMDGLNDDRTSSKVSFGDGLTSPQSLRSQSPSSNAEDGGEVASSGGYAASSPVSSSSRYMSAASSLHPASSSLSRYESATSGPPTSVSSPTSQQYETASQGSSSGHGNGGGRTYSSMSFDSHTLQPDR